MSEPTTRLVVAKRHWMHIWKVGHKPCVACHADSRVIATLGVPPIVHAVQRHMSVRVVTSQSSSPSADWNSGSTSTSPSGWAHHSRSRTRSSEQPKPVPLGCSHDGNEHENVPVVRRTGTRGR